ncbi:MAG TPA: type II toxin-antitoxin system PemK/MazF family toxin [Ilumatobacteraceae bacterium]|nr:type II toxin-antitoxin system PemK/MazF family toxin [Ilumatobacteraceae bacterium]
MTPSAGDVWCADRNDERRRLVYIVSDHRFHRLAGRVVIAPVLDASPGPQRPWYVPIAEGVVAANQFATVPVDRLLERVSRSDLPALQRVRRAVHNIVG